MRIPYSTSSFGPHWGANLASPATGYIQADWLDLSWAAITVGKPNKSHLTKHGISSYYDALMQVATIRSILDQSTYYTTSTLQNDLDPTELGFSSYKTGMTLSRLLSAHFFGVKWLFHLSLIKKLPGATVFSGSSYPDLIGQNNRGDWIVVEAKGTSGSYDYDMTLKGKRQTRSLRRVNGQYPTLRCVVQSHYTANILHAHIADPEGFNRSAKDIEFSLETAVDVYYSALRPLTAERHETLEIGGTRYLLFTHGYPGLEIAIPVNVNLMQELPNRQERLWADIGHGFRRYPDGLLLKAQN